MPICIFQHLCSLLRPRPVFILSLLCLGLNRIASATVSICDSNWHSTRGPGFFWLGFFIRVRLCHDMQNSPLTKKGGCKCDNIVGGKHLKLTTIQRILSCFHKWTTKNHKMYMIINYCNHKHSQSICTVSPQPLWQVWPAPLFPISALHFQKSSVKHPNIFGCSDTKVASSHRSLR